MRCFNHSEKRADENCSQCGRFVCKDCFVRLEFGVLCKNCIEKKLNGDEKKLDDDENELDSADLSRILAGVVDIIVVFISVFLGIPLFFGFSIKVWPTGFLAFIVGMLFYDFLFTAYLQKTIGKLLFGLSVVGEKEELAKRSILKTVFLGFILGTLGFGFFGLILFLIFSWIAILIFLWKKRMAYDYFVKVRVV